MDSTRPGNPLARFLRALTNIQRNEMAAVLLSFLLVFVLMSSYSILKPLRDALAADWGNVGLSLTWTVNFGVSLLAVAAYNAALTYVRFRIMVPAVYVFFALSFLALYLLRTTLPDPVLVNKTFYVWVSVFSLFNLSVFWSFMTDVFKSEQARRVFGVIAAGTTVGAITGPSITAALVDSLGADGLLLLSAALLFSPLVAVPMLRSLKETRLGNPDPRAGEGGLEMVLGKNALDGFSELLKDRYLLGICAFILLYVTINTFVYFELQNLTREYSLEFRAKIWSLIEITTNVLTLVTAALITGRIVTRLGMTTALSLMPVFVLVGVLALVASPVLLVLGIFQVGRRVGNYAVTRPSREMLFTVLSREARFKSKPVIDVVVYRGGDVASGWLFTLLASAFGLGLKGVAVMIGIVAVLWGLIAVWLGRRYAERNETATPGGDGGEKPRSAVQGNA
ncbi:MAG: MFS transporter [Woeseiaceae bacterium]|nr:MFS transporter [Woeseiaceae bacterium]